VDEDSIIQSKRCSKCKEIKSISAFSIQRDTKSGRRSHCKECEHDTYIVNRQKKIEKNKAYYLEHKEERLAYAHSYRIINAAEICEKQRLARIVHLTERREYDHKRYKDNCEEMIASGHNRRTAGGKRITAQIVCEVKLESNGICSYCNQPIVNGHIDHIIPVIKGGTNDKDNLLYVCSICNMRKGSKDLDEFLSTITLVLRRNKTL